MDPSDTLQPIIARSAGAENKKETNNHTFDALPCKPQASSSGFPVSIFFYIFQIYVTRKVTKQINQRQKKHIENKPLCEFHAQLHLIYLLIPGWPTVRIKTTDSVVFFKNLQYPL